MAKTTIRAGKHTPKKCPACGKNIIYRKWEKGSVSVYYSECHDCNLRMQVDGWLALAR